MQLAPPPGMRETPSDVATALEAARRSLGHRPAVTVLRAARRDEQGVASLAQWAAKGAHLLEADLLLDPGDRVRLDVAAGWTTAAVALAAWWAGVAITLDGSAEVAVLQEGRPAPQGAVDVLRVGDAVDGAPTVASADEAWIRAVQVFPDQPPAPRASPDLVALEHGGASWTQAQLLREAGTLADTGTLGIDAARVDAFTALVAVALRPLVVARPTVVLDGVDRHAAAGERVTTWLDG